MTITDTKAMYADYCTGMTLPQVADKWDTSSDVVTWRFRKAGFPTRRGGRGGPPASLVAAMYADYCTGMTLQQVGDKWGCCGYTVYQRFKRLGLRRRHSATNFTAANADRTKQAAAATLPLVEAALPTAKPRARAVLQLRLEHPEASLAELAALHEPPLTKNTVASILWRAKRKADA